MNVLSLFDGMSCGQIALERAGIKVDKYFASEIKKAGIKVTMANYPNTIQLGDVRNVRYENGVLYSDNGSFEVEIDLMIGGSPCQDFSQANKEKLGLEGLKSGLFYEWLRIRNEVNPKYYLLENVSMDCRSRETISQLVGTYPVEINSSLVSAQLRQRSYWTNIGKEDFDLMGNRYCVIALPKDRGILLQNVLEFGYVNCSKHNCINRRSYNRCDTAESQKYLIKRNKTTGMVTLIYNDVLCDEKNGVRTLTQTEGERLQTVPEGYTSVLTPSQAIDCLGDGWTIDVICHLLKPLIECL